jgi:hypothetical protein
MDVFLKGGGSSLRVECSLGWSMGMAGQFACSTKSSRVPRNRPRRWCKLIKFLGSSMDNLE